jgi:ABC-2 type transport system permease protein
MTPFAALLRKELRSYFGGPLWYLVAAAFLAYTGFYLHSDLVYFLTFGFGMNIMENLWQLVFFDMRLVLILSIPLLTMRLLAEERRLGTLELLLTYPLSDQAVVAAKFLACLVAVAALLLATTTYPALVYVVQPFALKPIGAGYLACCCCRPRASPTGSSCRRSPRARCWRDSSPSCRCSSCGCCPGTRRPSAPTP